MLAVARGSAFHEILAHLRRAEFPRSPGAACTFMAGLWSEELICVSMVSRDMTRLSRLRPAG